MTGPSEPTDPRADEGTTWRPPAREGLFYVVLGTLGGLYVLLIVLMLAADVLYAARNPWATASVLWTPEIRYSAWLSLTSATVTTILALWSGIPLGYLLSRHRFPGRRLVDAILDVPVFLPPLVVGLSLLILFRQTPFKYLDDWCYAAFGTSIALDVPAVVLAQYAVATAFAVRALQATFDEIPVRTEQVARTLGASRGQAFLSVVLPQAHRGVLTAATLAWARALGEFGPILIFAGTTRGKVEVLPVSVHLEFAIGNIEGAVGISLLMIAVATVPLVVMRYRQGRSPR